MKLKQWLKATVKGANQDNQPRKMSDVDKRRLDKEQNRDQDKFMGKIYQCVKTHRDAEAIILLLSRYGDTTLVPELETVYERVEEWGPSRTLLCVGRLIIHLLDEEKRFGRAIVYIEKCQNISSKFVIADLSKTLFYVRFAIETGKSEMARNMLIDADERYGTLVNQKQCQAFLQQILKNDIDIIL